MAPRPAAGVGVALAALLAVQGCGTGAGMSLAPVSTAGSVQTILRSRKSVGGDTEHAALVAGKVNLESYIWQPWFARVSGDFGLAVEQTYGDEDTLVVRGNGAATLSVLPLSKYPVTLSLAHLDNRVSGEGTDADQTRDRAALSARAVLTQNLSGGLTASWDRADREDSGVLDAQNLSFDLTQTFGDEQAFLGVDSIRLSGGYRRSRFAADDPADDDRSRDSATLQLDILAEPIADVKVNGLLTVAQDDLTEGDSSFRRLAVQGVTTAQWRPAGRPYVVTGSVRALSEEIDRNENGTDADSSTLLTAGTIGLRWPVDDRFSFNLGLRGAYEDVRRDPGAAQGESDLDAGERYYALALAGADYLSDPRDLAGFDWRWNAHAQLQNGIRSDTGLASENAVSIGQRLERMLDEGFFLPLRFSFDQSAQFRVSAEGDDPFSFGLTHSAAFDYAQAGDGVSTFGRLYLRDSRNFTGETSEFQMVQLRIGRQMALDRDRRLQGTVTAQAIRQADEDDTDLSITASGEISYHQRELFDVENLSLRSELRLNVAEIDAFFDSREDTLDRDRFRNDWRNLLGYRIGRLTAELEATGFQRDSGFGYLAMLRLRRDFGGNE